LPIFGARALAGLERKILPRLRREGLGWLLSQFMHGEQGALLATAQLAVLAPDAEMKLYAATQVVDEARHLEVFERYLREKVGLSYPMSPVFKRTLLDRILTDPRWDIKFLGMQIVSEGLAMAAFQMIHEAAREPLIRDILRGVILDEARHFAFGVLALRDLYANEMSFSERRERQEFALEACVVLKERYLARELWEKMDLPVEECEALSLRSPALRDYWIRLFSRVVPALRHVGLLDAWLTEKLERSQIIGHGEQVLSA
jgi:para-aminobenzoate N-oxygenase AurF